MNDLEQDLQECLVDLDRIRRITMVLEADFEMLNEMAAAAICYLSSEALEKHFNGHRGSFDNCERLPCATYTKLFNAFEAFSRPSTRFARKPDPLDSRLVTMIKRLDKYYGKD